MMMALICFYDRVLEVSGIGPLDGMGETQMVGFDGFWVVFDEEAAWDLVCGGGDGVAHH